MRSVLPTSCLSAVPEDVEGTVPSSPPKGAELSFSRSYTECFDDRFMVETSDLNINVYSKGTFDQMPLFFCIHGAGFSGLSFGPLVQRIASEVYCVAPDLRGHGLTVQKDGSTTPGADLTVERFLDDAQAVIKDIFDNRFTPKENASDKRTLILCGHSLGGSLAAKLAARLQADYDVPLCILIDITESVAIGAIPNMSTVIRKKPTVFNTEAALANWLVASHTLLNKSAALFQAPGLIYGKDSETPGKVIADLGASGENWKAWFEGLNDCFYTKFQGYRLLFISGMEKLDKDTEIMHMQGRLAIEVIKGANHNLHEEKPNELAFFLIRYLRRMHYTRGLLGKPFNFTSKDPDEDPIPLNDLRTQFGDPK
ncbi:Protein phosphatase methylesterase-1 [Giardia muris]|uniref:Protein phosphatase methylesterase 1 n=1 Tax=Giardia muris TaxID=5742 RepID=A0A4Z1SQD1_GIAMU|nr:Protein phosphatase methylesterase-1 [Giardia muris]|eukprot:TNJ27115.1 Protein phosphatase methylesterase-1 [Giardia muris]